MFANRSFVAKFVNPDVRDIGFQLDYKITGVPLTAHLGVYNGRSEYRSGRKLYGRGTAF
jgi:hypothetical protein